MEDKKPINMGKLKDMETVLLYKIRKPEDFGYNLPLPTLPPAFKSRHYKKSGI